MLSTCTCDCHVYLTLFFGHLSLAYVVYIFFFPFQITLFSTWVRLVRRHLLCRCTITTSQTWLGSSVSIYTVVIHTSLFSKVRVTVVPECTFYNMQMFLHTSQITHLLLYPSLWLAVLRLSSHFCYCSSLQPSVKVNTGQQYLWIVATRFYTL